MTKRMEQVQAALDLLVKDRDVGGVVLLTRDGVTVASAGRGIAKPELFAAMAAAMMGAARTAVQQVAQGEPSRLVVTVDARRFVIVPAPGASLLALMTEPTWQESTGLPRLASALMTLRVILA